MRVLHVIDPQSPDGGPCTMRLLGDVVRRLEGRHQALVIGGRREIEVAVGCGVDVAGSICPPRALPWAGVSALRQAANSLERSCGRHDLVHAWTARSGALASVAFADRSCLTTLHAGPGSGVEAWHSLRTLRQSVCSIFTATTAIKRQLRGRQFNNDRLTLLPPGVGSHGASADRSAKRRLLAERCEADIDADTFVVGLLGEPASGVDANVAATIVARVALSGRPLKLLVHPSAAHRSAAESTMHHLGFDDVILVDELIAQPWFICDALDAALLVESVGVRQSAASVLPLLNALSCGTPVVCEHTESLHDVLEDGAGCMVVMPGEVNAAAERLVRLFDDLELRHRMAEQGRTLVADMFGIDAYVVRLRHAYDLLLANRTVQTTADPFVMAEVSAEAAAA